MPHLVIICGAGSTLNESKATRTIDRPPLDRGFFKHAKKIGGADYDAVAEYLATNYSIDPTHPQFDSLEQIMAVLYSDVFNPAVKGSPSIIAFRSLLKLINSRIANTTNPINPTKYSVLYRMLRNELLSGRSANEISLITFNYDLLIEKVVFALQQSSSMKHLQPLSQFPACYRLRTSRNSKPPKSSQQFPRTTDPLTGIEILKLHGSLNWFSKHRSRDPSPTALLNPNRELWVTPRRTVPTDMTMRAKSRTLYTYPIVVPPVINKASILHESLSPVWTHALQALESAVEVVVFGYSCPSGDQESANLMTRALRDNTNLTSLTIIDPTTYPFQRFADLTAA